MKKNRFILGMCIVFAPFVSSTIAETIERKYTTQNCCSDRCQYTEGLTKQQVSACKDGCNLLGDLSSDIEKAKKACDKKQERKKRYKDNYPVSFCKDGAMYKFHCRG